MAMLCIVMIKYINLLMKYLILIKFIGKKPLQKHKIMIGLQKIQMVIGLMENILQDLLKNWGAILLA